MIGPDFSTPDVAIEQQWGDPADSGISQQPGDYSQWWRVFDDPVLDTLIHKARDQNLSLQIAGIRIYEARAQLGIAVGIQPLASGVRPISTVCCSVMPLQPTLPFRPSKNLTVTQTQPGRAAMP